MNTRDKAIELLKEHFTDRELMLYIKSSDLVYESILDTVQKALNIDLVIKCDCCDKDITNQSKLCMKCANEGFE